MLHVANHVNHIAAVAALAVAARGRGTKQVRSEGSAARGSEHSTARHSAPVEGAAVEHDLAGQHGVWPDAALDDFQPVLQESKEDDKENEKRLYAV